MSEINRKNKLMRHAVIFITVFIPLLLAVFIVQPFLANVAIAQSDEDGQPQQPLASGGVTTTVYLPLIQQPLATPALLSLSLPESQPGSLGTSEITATWTAVSGTTTYVVEESGDVNFTSPTVYTVGNVTSYLFSQPSDWDNRQFYYRVRAVGDSASSGWSNVLTQHYIYHDTFNDPASGWEIRRQDTDDVDQETFYDDGNFKMKIRGRWDSMIAGPLTTVPDTWDSYRIDTVAKLGEGIDNLHSYGIIFGGDYNEANCPNSTYSGCFNHYYRINVLWFGAPDAFRVQLKRIDFHDLSTGKDVGETLFGWTDLPVPDTADWNKWSIEVLDNGRIRIFLNDALVADVADANYVGPGFYFGTFASTDEYSGTAAWFTYYRIEPLP